MKSYSFSVCRTSEADSETINQAFSLWEDTFCDDKSFITFMFSRTLKDSFLFTAKNERGNLCSMFFLSDIGYNYGGNKYPAYYLYAVATLLCERRKGLYSALYNYAEDILTKRHVGPFFIICVPQSSMLFGFYKRFGFQKRIYRNYFAVCPGRTIDNIYNFEKCSCTNNELYEAYLSETDKYQEHLIKSKSFFINSVSIRLIYGYSLVSVKKNGSNKPVGYLIIKESNKSVTVTESYLKKISETEILNCLSAALSKKVYCRTPYCGSGKRIKPYGAVKAFNINIHPGFCFADYLFD